MLKKPFEKLRRALSCDRGATADEELAQKPGPPSLSPSGTERQAGKPTDGPISIAASQTSSRKQVARVAQVPAAVDGLISIPVPTRGRLGGNPAAIAREMPTVKEPISIKVPPPTMNSSQQILSMTENPTTASIQGYVVFTRALRMSIANITILMIATYPKIPRSSRPLKPTRIVCQKLKELRFRRPNHIRPKIS